MCADDGAAVADMPSAAMPRGRGDGGRGRGRGRGSSSSGPAFVLSNPKYLKRRPPNFSGGGGGGGGTREPREQRGPPGASSFGGSDAPSSGGDDGMDSSGGRGGDGPRRMNKKPAAGAWKEAPKRNEMGAKSQQGKKKAGAGDDWSRPMATARAPRKKGKRGGNKVVAPVVDRGPARVSLGDTITVGELAQQLRVGAAEVVKDLMRMGVLASITQSIDAETAEKIALAQGAEVTRSAGDSDDVLTGSALGIVDDEDDEDVLEKRPPVVTIMGHVRAGPLTRCLPQRTGGLARLALPARC